MPSLTLNVNNFINIEANATKPYFDRHIFRKFDFLPFLIRILPFSLQFSHFCIILTFI